MLIQDTRIHSVNVHVHVRRVIMHNYANIDVAESMRFLRYNYTCIVMNYLVINEECLDGVIDS